MAEAIDIDRGERPLLPIVQDEDQRSRFVFHDQRILDEACNLACGYCAPSGFPMRIDKEGGAHMPPSWRETLSVVPAVDETLPEQPQLTDFFALGERVISAMSEETDSQILKLSGGEITLYPQLVDYVRNVHDRYSAVQVLTNGYKLTQEQIDDFADMGNIYFQISLDGTTQETNRARTPNGHITQKVIGNLERISEKGMPIEINCVLTRFNTGSFDIMLDTLKGMGDIVVVPRPVRGGGRKLLDFDQEQLEAFRQVVIDRYDEFESILPPKPYLDRLVSMMADGYRSNRCYVPFFVQGVDNYGNAETCACGGTMPMLGNVLENPDEVFDRHQAGTNYDPGEEHDDCSYCMTQYEIMNLYIEGAISREKMLKIPSFRFGGVLDEIDRIGARLLDKGILTVPRVES
jgi:MoaA/NifB/PqqE/SkfB family radical SAM enzyme